MKKLYILILISILPNVYSKAQTANQLVRLNNMADNNAMNAISSPFQGNLVYVSSSNDIYYFDGISWNLIGGGGSTNDTNDDAWGVTGEDLVSDISRTGKVTIGPSGNTTVKLDVNGGACIRNLPNDDYGRVVLHSSIGELHSDRYTSHFHNTGYLPPGGWVDINYVKNGAVVTGAYTFTNTCASGHFQFRYQAGSSPLFVMIYHSGNAAFSNQSGYYRVVGGWCSSTAYFRVFNNMLQVQGPLNPLNGALRLDIRVEAY